MIFTEAEKYLISLGNEVETMKLGLENIRKLLKALGDPQTNYLKVQIAGTNGKGSVCAFLDSICREAKIRTGVFTSPHLVSITERIRIQGRDISEDDFAAIATQVQKTSEKLVAEGLLATVPTYFEQVTAMALVAFREAKVELAILETGMGGRFDATTAANAEIAAITRIDLDHQEYLGDTIEEIAGEKAAIIRDDSHVVIGKQPEKAMKVILEHCLRVEATVSSNLYEPWTIVADNGAVRINTTRLFYPKVELGLRGRHQIENAEIALNVVQALKYESVFDLSFEVEELGAFAEGLEKARHPGRLEYVGNILFDGAHNIAGAKALREYLDEFVTQPITMIFAAMKDKEIAEIGEILFPKAATLILTKPENPRAIDPVEIVAQMHDGIEAINVVGTKTVKEATTQAVDVAGDDGLILVTGSLYLIGEVKQILKSQI